MSIVIRESVDVDDVLLELLEDRLDDEDESPVVMNNDLPLKFALTSLNWIGVVVLVAVAVVVVPEEDESSFVAQEIMVRLKRNIRIMCKTFFILSSILKIKIEGPVTWDNVTDLERNSVS